MGGKVSGGGWHFVLDFLIIPGSVTPLTPRALKGPRGRCYTTRGNLNPGAALAQGPRRIHESDKCFDVSGTPGKCTQGWESVPRSPFETSLSALHELLLRGRCPLEHPSCPLSHGNSHKGANHEHRMRTSTGHHKHPCHWPSPTRELSQVGWEEGRSFFPHV